MVRRACLDKNGMKRGAWSDEEDNKLRAYIQRYGHWNWRQLPQFAGLSRCGKSCRLRWLNYLRPNDKRGNYSTEEEDLIIKLHNQLGNKWSIIATKLPGRTDNEIKNYWHRHLNKRAKQNLTLEKRSSEISQSEENHEEESIEISQFIPKQERGFEPPSHLNPESFLLSPEPSSSEISSLNSEDSMGSSSSESFVDTLGNFWTEPFLAENDTIASNYMAQLVNHGLQFPSYPIFDEQFLCLFDLSDDFLIHCISKTK